MKSAINKFIANYIKRRESLRKNGLFKYITGSSGYVLIVVLLVIALLVTMSTEFLMVAQTNINYIRKFSERSRANMIARAGVNLATLILKADKLGLSQSLIGKQATDKNIDSYMDLWALDFPPLPIEGGSVKIIIDDENSKINLNVLANEVVDSTPYYGITQRFLLNMGLLMDYADNIKDWVDIDDSRSPYGAESSDYYLNLESPYQAKNGAMDSIDEAMMIRDITPEIFYGMEKTGYEAASESVDNNKGDTGIDMEYILKLTQDAEEKTIEKEKSIKLNIAREKSRRLADYLRVSGNREDFTSELNKININTASYRVLSALTDNMTDDIVREIISKRLETPYTKVDALSSLIDDETVRKNILSVKSYIFRITAIATINRTTVKITGIYYRDNERFLYWSEY